MRIFNPLAAMLLSLSSLTALATEPLDAFPPAKAGEQRFVITVPPLEKGQEDNVKVEIIAGLEVMGDSVNRLRLASTLEQRSLKGWGYDYYEVEGSSEVLSTMMAPPEGEEKVKRFVAGASLMVRYNSRLPLVVYAPEGYEVRYRLWRAGEEKTAEKK